VTSNLEIAPMIDHPAFRKMINDLVKLQKKGKCLKLIAIDAGDDIDLRRDEWMAIKLAEQVSETPILVLLGGLHSLKKVNWDFSKGKPYVAEILSSQGYNIKTYPQIWLDKSCSPPKQLKNRFIPAEKPEALALLNDHFISLLNAFNYESAIDVVDGVIVWECIIKTSSNNVLSEKPNGLFLHNAQKEIF